MEIDDNFIRHVSKTARLNLSDEEVKKFVPQFKEMLEAFSILDEVDVTNTKLSMQPIEVRNVLREDSPRESFPRDVALSQSRLHKKEGYFKGPKAV